MRPSYIVASPTLPELSGCVHLGALEDGRYVLHIGPDASLDLPEAEVLYDPTPQPFVWDNFAAAHPELAESLVPHQWAGE